jgi:hypothetical protein
MAMVHEHTVFNASPGNTEQDRQLVPAPVEEINGSFAPEGQRLCVSPWERDVHPDAGRPQTLINQPLGSYDILVAVLWRRMGTPTAGFGSRLLDSAPPGRKLSGADIIADIAKHGTGPSVERLRQHGVQPRTSMPQSRAQLDVVQT